jgi:nitrogen fixation protein NifB
MKMNLDRNNHPCFNDQARHQYGRIHLPVAPRCNIQCNFCNRKYDCVNESRPGVTGAVLTPGQAVHYLEKAISKAPNISVAGIAGPGEPFANPEETLETLNRVSEKFPKLLLCIASNGLNIHPYTGQLARLRISHVTVTINAVQPEIGQHIYSWIRDGKVIYRGIKAAELLIERQLEAVKELKARGITVKINSIIIPGINDRHIRMVAQKMQESGADIMNCIPLFPVNHTVFENLEQPSPVMVSLVRNEAAQYLPQMTHCTRCRADAVGLLDSPNGQNMQNDIAEASRLPSEPSENRPYVAVASLEGLLINQHLGEATELGIYAQVDSNYTLIETRKTPEPGGGKERWSELSRILNDCRAVLVSSAGESPKEILKSAGIKIIEIEGLIEEALNYVYTGQEARCLKMRRFNSCGSGCKGSGMGCG